MIPDRQSTLDTAEAIEEIIYELLCVFFTVGSFVRKCAGW